MVYVGQSRNIEQRWREHKNHLRNGKHHATRLQKSWIINGEKAFIFQIAELVPDLTRLDEREQCHMDNLNSSNHTKGFNNLSYVLGVATPSAETRLKRSIALKGRKRTAEHCAKISAAKKGVKLTPEARANIKAAMSRPEVLAKVSVGWGRIPTEETRAKMSATRTGRERTAKHCANISVALKGIKRSEETRAKMRNRIVTKITRDKISAANKGRVRTPEARAKMSASHKGRAPTNKGVSHTLETREKMSAAQKARLARVKAATTAAA